MPSEMSLPLFVKVRFDFDRMAVRDWATVSAMPPRTYDTYPAQHCALKVITRFAACSGKGGVPTAFVIMIVKTMWRCQCNRLHIHRTVAFIPGLSA